MQNYHIDTSGGIQTKIMVNNTLHAPLCSHVRLANGIHTFVFQESSRAAVDQWIDYMDDILGIWSFDNPVRLSLDTRYSGALPIVYMTLCLRDLFANYDKRPCLRIALISDQGALMILVQMLAQITSSDDQNVVQYYQAREDVDAIQWLLESN